MKGRDDTVYVPTKGGALENPRILKISLFSRLVNY